MDVNSKELEISILISIKVYVAYLHFQKKILFFYAFHMGLLITKNAGGKLHVMKFITVMMVEVLVIEITYLSYDGENSKELEFVSDVGHKHAANSLGTYGGQPFIVGGKDHSSGYHNVTETLGVKSNGQVQWKKEEDWNI